jgi:hypothetical protein
MSEPYSVAQLQRWREQVTHRTVDPDLPWPDRDVMVLVERFLDTIEPLLAPPPASGDAAHEPMLRMLDGQTYFIGCSCGWGKDGDPRRPWTIHLPAPAEPTLDVERLRKAWEQHRVTTKAEAWGEECTPMCARDLAHEYARLAASPEGADRE